MKTSLTKTLALALLLLAVNLATIAAPMGGRSRKDESPARKELKAYVEQNVLPVVRQQRQKLEAQLATADKEQLAVYRTQLKELRQRGHALRQSSNSNQTTAPKPAEAAGSRPALTEAQQQQLQQLRTETKTILLNVAQLAQKYASNITQLAQEVQPQKERWATDMQAIITKNATPEQLEKRGQFQGRMLHRAGGAKFMRPVAFLLLDPNAPAPALSPAEHTPGGTSLYLNPVVATSQLDYSVTKAGPVTVELLDGRGNALRTVAQETKLEKGTHTLQVNLSDLPAGTYYYKITTRAGSETKRFVKQ